jgi:hypothetical protein
MVQILTVRLNTGTHTPRQVKGLCDRDFSVRPWSSSRFCAQRYLRQRSFRQISWVLPPGSRAPAPSSPGWPVPRRTDARLQRFSKNFVTPAGPILKDMIEHDKISPLFISLILCRSSLRTCNSRIPISLLHTWRQIRAARSTCNIGTVKYDSTSSNKKPVKAF